MKTLTRLGGLAAALALSIPAVAQAHPGVYSVDARIAKTAAHQTITLDANGGTFRPSAGAASVAFDATADQVQAALQADPAIGYENIKVTGPAKGPYGLTWTGTLAGNAVAPIAPDSSSLAGATATATVTVDRAGGTAVTFLTDALGTLMATQKQYVAVSDGFALGYRETNGVAGGGLLNLKALPSGFRASMTPEQKIEFTAAHTGLQLHATCTGVPALEDATNIYSTQKRTDGDPFYGYIPWQKASAGFDDDPAAWIPAVKSITAGLPGAPADGVDLSSLNTTADFTTACTNLGGRYHPADTSSQVASAMVADAVTAATDPLNARIAQLTTERDAALAANNAAAPTITGDSAALTAANTAAAAARAEADAAKAEVARLKAQTGKLTLAIDGPVALDGTRTPVSVTGPAGAPVLLRVVVSHAAATRLHLKSRVLGSVTKLIGADGTAKIDVTIAAKARKAANRAGVRRISVDAISGDRYTSIPAGS